MKFAWQIPQQLRRLIFGAVQDSEVSVTAGAGKIPRAAGGTGFIDSAYLEGITTASITIAATDGNHTVQVTNGLITSWVPPG